jgi:hypothetical protein
MPILEKWPSLAFRLAADVIPVFGRLWERIRRCGDLVRVLGGHDPCCVP